MSRYGTELPGREVMIERLIEDWYNSVTSDSETIWHVLMNGFAGYSNMSDVEIAKEYLDANLDEVYAE